MKRPDNRPCDSTAAMSLTSSATLTSSRVTKLRVSHFPAPKHDGHLDLVALLQKPPGILEFELEVMLLGFGAHLDFLEFDLGGFFLGFGSPLAGLVLVLAVVHDAAYRRRCVGGDLDEIKTPLGGCGQSLIQAEDAELPPLVIDDPHFPGANGAVDVGFWLSYDATS